MPGIMPGTGDAHDTDSALARTSGDDLALTCLAGVAPEPALHMQMLDSVERRVGTLVSVRDPGG